VSPLTWSDIIALIIRFGIDHAYKIWEIARSGEPDEAAWAKLRALSLKTYDQYIAEAQARALPAAVAAAAAAAALPVTKEALWPGIGGAPPHLPVS
jgi:hypothetical protein